MVIEIIKYNCFLKYSIYYGIIFVLFYWMKKDRDSTLNNLYSQKAGI